MRLITSSIDEALGGILVHNVADREGHKALLKGRQLAAEDIDQLRTLGKREVYVALLEPGDVRENDAVTRLAQAVAGNNVSATATNPIRHDFFIRSG